MKFLKGDVVEISPTEDGFHGSYYLATVLTRLDSKNYWVQYTNLVSDDGIKPLKEVVGVETMRPRPPDAPVAEFSLKEIVDVYANDGWWIGMVTRMSGLMCSVYFDSTGEEIEYPVYRMRVHQDFVKGKWVVSGKKV